MNKQTKNPELENMLTELDPPYEWKEELAIGRMLDQYGIPFFYKQPTIIYAQGKNEVWHPTFTLSRYGGFVIDYMAEPFGQDQRDSVLKRQEIYNYNQIPSVVLGPKYLDKAIWRELLYKKLEQRLRQPVKVENYAMSYSHQ